MALVALLVFSGGSSAHPDITTCPHFYTAGQAAPLTDATWSLKGWKRLDSPKAAIRVHRKQVRCAAGLGHRSAIKRSWERHRAAFHRYQRDQLAELDINHRWAAHWAPDYSGPTLPPYVIAALAEKAGDLIGVDVPGWTMEQMTIGESGRRPGSAGVDVGGTYGMGLWAITSPFADSILARWGWGYDDMRNPVRCAVAMAEIYAAQGLGAWYGDGFVTSSDAHYRGRFDLRLVLGGISLRQALRR